MELGDLYESLHVVQGALARGSLREALGLNPQQILFNDVYLSVGPAPKSDDLDIWRSMRKQFARDDLVNEQYWWSEEADEHEVTVNLERFVDDSPVFVWVAVGLPEQLLLAWMVYVFDQLELDPSRLRVVQIESMLSGQQFLSISEMRPEQIGDFHTRQRQLNSEESEALRNAWRVYTSDDPSDLSAYIAEPSPLPLLHEAVSQLVDRYPDKQSGLSVWDERLLHYTAERGPNAARVIGYAMGYNERLDYASDDYLFPRLRALGRSDIASPLIKIAGSSQIMRDCRVTLTPFGEKVLAGEASHVEVNGIDDWVGGVHLSSAADNVTFRDGESLVLPS